MKRPDLIFSVFLLASLVPPMAAFGQDRLTQQDEHAFDANNPAKDYALNMLALADRSPEGKPLWHDVRAYGATPDGCASTGGSDDSAAFASAISAANTDGGGVVVIPPGKYNAKVTVSYPHVSLIGSGPASELCPSTGTVLTVSDINQGRGGVFRDLRISSGTDGIYINGASRARFQNIYITGVFDEGILVNGDASTETFFENIYINDIFGTGFHYTRTSSDRDLGGIYLNTVHVTGTSTGVGFHFESSRPTQTTIALFGDQLIADNRSTHGFVFDNVQNVRLNRIWATGSASGEGLVRFEDAVDVIISEGWVQNTSYAGYNMEFAGSSLRIQSSGLRISGPGTAIFFHADASANESYIDNVITTASSLTNDHDKFARITTKGSAVNAYLAAAPQTVFDNEWTKIWLDAEGYDFKDDFDTSSNTFTARTSGLHNITGAVYYGSPVAKKSYAVGIYINATTCTGTPAALARTHAASTAPLTAVTTTTVMLTKGDRVVLCTFHNSGKKETVSNGMNATYMTVNTID